jgi:hypothetical protein
VHQPLSLELGGDLHLLPRLLALNAKFAREKGLGINSRRHGALAIGGTRGAEIFATAACESYPNRSTARCCGFSSRAMKACSQRTFEWCCRMPASFIPNGVQEDNAAAAFELVHRVLGFAGCGARILTQ